MEKAKRYSEIDLADFYAISPVFKRYSQLNLWSENFSEYHNIKYCESYLSQYFFGCTQKYILDHFSEYFLLTFQNNQKFVKFIKSGFLKYINQHFLLLFRKNRFFFFRDSHKEVETFVEEYFQKHIKIFFEQDLLRCIIACVNEVVPNSFKKYLNIRIKYFLKDLLLIESNVKFLSNSKIILNFCGRDKKEWYSLGFVDYKDTIKTFYFHKKKANRLVSIKSFYFFPIEFRYKIYKSFNLSKKVPSVLISSFFLEDTIYSWGFCLNDNHILFDIPKTYIVSKYFIFNKSIKFSLKAHSFLFYKYGWCFYTFPKCIYKSFSGVIFQKKKKENHSFNNDFLFFFESYKTLVSFDSKRNDIGIYRDSINVF